ncbi:MAG TPA: hypothetical protein VIS74_00935 [Chthoniobacterales bacterium]
MKSAYELAMSRLEKSSPTIALTEAQKRELAEIDSLYTAKIAERRLLLEPEIARSAGNPAERESLRKQLRSEVARLEEECAAKKERVRRAG